MKNIGIFLWKLSGFWWWHFQYIWIGVFSLWYILPGTRCWQRISGCLLWRVRAVFCDTSKVFDHISHAGLLLHKLRSVGIFGEPLKWFTCYLDSRKQRVILQRVESKWNYIKSGVPQGTVLEPLFFFFLISINDIVTEIGYSILLFTDDTGLLIIADNPHAATEILMQALTK